MALLFQKPSLRTRVSFEAAMANLGGSSLFLGSDVGWQSRESVADFGRILSQYVDVIVVRARHQDVTELAAHCQCCVINGLTEIAHPCQALADLYTLRERVGRLPGATLAYLGDGNNVAKSLALACGKTGVRFRGAMPEGYAFDAEFLKLLRREVPQLDMTITADPREAVREADAVYTDVWASMGQEAEREIRKRAFSAFQVNESLLSNAPSQAVFMHCLPAHRGEEVTDAVIDGPQSIVVVQAANRMHVQKGVLAWLLAGSGEREA
jgi:ornithine carbamoyltransferase